MQVSAKDIAIVEIPPTRRAIRKFVNFSHALYRDDPRYVPNLRFDDINVLLPQKNPAFAYCEAKYFMAYVNGKPAGKIAAIINYAYIDKWGRKNGRFGFTADAEWYEYQLIIPEKGNDKIARFSELSKERNGLRRVNLQSKKQLYDVAPNVFRLINTCFPICIVPLN